MTKAWDEIEVATRRGLSEALHPDVCDKLTIQGVQWAIPPMIPDRALRFAPQIDGDQVDVAMTAQTSELDPAWVELGRKLLDLAPVADDEECCEMCGRPLRTWLELEPARHADFMRTLIQYTVRALRKQYDLSDTLLTRLLSFQGCHVPPWVPQVIAHAAGGVNGG